MPPGYVIGPAREPDRLSELSVAAAVLFGCVAVAQLLDAMAGSSGRARDVFDVLTGVLLLALIPVFQLGGTVLSNVFTAVAALLAVRVVTKVTRMQQDHRPTLR